MQFQLRLIPERKNPPSVYQPAYDHQFNLSELYAHPSHKDYYRSFIEGRWRFTHDKRKITDAMRSSFVAEFAASVATGLAMPGYMEFGTFIEHQLKACRNKIINLGFKEVKPRDVREVLQRRNTEIVVLIPGCQDEYMLDRRVDALIEFTKNQTGAGVQFKLILSGRCPPLDVVQIQDEATRMANLFRTKLGQSKPDLLNVIDIISISGEAQSLDTKQNVKNFFGHSSFKDTKTPSTVVVISSTFHLIRLWREIDRNTERQSIRGPNRRQRQILRPKIWRFKPNGSPEMSADGKQQNHDLGREIRDLFLIGAEETWRKAGLQMGDREFIKLMMYDIYDAYLTEQPHLKEEYLKQGSAKAAKRKNASQAPEKPRLSAKSGNGSQRITPQQRAGLRG